ncbi:MAG TPA: hypothetical protein VJC17_03670 [Candidatus Dojkabacteria bacterium]|nr:hypothetical protein [Candidatus Dojkabacteria bacterium]
MSRNFKSYTFFSLIFLLGALIFSWVQPVKALSDAEVNNRGFGGPRWDCTTAVGVTTSRADTIEFNPNGVLNNLSWPGYRSEFFAEPYKNLCVRDEVREVAGLHQTIGYKEIFVCINNYRVGISFEDKKPTQYDLGISTDTRAYDVCCPSDKPIIYYTVSNYIGSAGIRFHKKCCPSGADYSSTFDADPNNCAPGVASAIPTKWLQPVYGTSAAFAASDYVFYADVKKAKSRFTCDIDGCVLQNVGLDSSGKITQTTEGLIDTLQPNSPSTNNTYAKADIESKSLYCVQPGDRLDIYTAHADYKETVCLDGKKEDAEEFYRSGKNALVSCRNLDEPEKTICEKCIGKNTESSSNFLYTSLGCIDTSRDGLITRVFQIGIGLFGGFMVFRLISAALLRQTNDPAKIQESNEMITSSIIALIVLVGAAVILNFLGINILGIVRPGTFTP